jgi:hypothetical protein
MIINVEYFLWTFYVEELVGLVIDRGWLFGSVFGCCLISDLNICYCIIGFLSIFILLLSEGFLIFCRGY